MAADHAERPRAPLLWRTFVARRFRIHGERIDDACAADAWLRFREARSRKREREGLGARTLLIFADVLIAFHGALRARGVEPQGAEDAVWSACWSTVRPLASWPWRLARLRSPDPLTRIAACIRVMLWFPFRAPSFRVTSPERGASATTMNVTRCPLAVHFAAAGEPALCSATFCRTDVALAESWGLQLQRTTTLVEGDRCDFCWRRDR